jgi:phosphoglycerol transferase
MPEFKNTIIVLASDHLSPNSHLFKDQNKNIQRRDLLLVQGDEITPGNINKLSTTLDTYPTLLSLLGSSVNKANLGTNMLSGDKSLAEKHQNLHQKLNGWSHQLKKFN